MKFGGGPVKSCAIVTQLMGRCQSLPGLAPDVQELGDPRLSKILRRYGAKLVQSCGQSVARCRYSGLWRAMGAAYGFGNHGIDDTELEQVLGRYLHARCRILSARGIAPPEPPSPRITAILGTSSKSELSVARAMASAWPRSSASTPGNAPAVSTSDITGRLNRFARSMRRTALR